LLCRSLWAPWREKWRHFAWPVKVFKSGIFKIWKRFQNPEIFMILPLIQIFKIPLLSSLKGQSKCVHFFGPGYYFANIRQAGDYYPFTGTPSLEPNMKHTHAKRFWQPSSVPLVHWKSFWV
jgi:hypothetical protein